jgi:hypothetical protein
VGGVDLIRNSGERKGNTFYPVYVAYAVKRLFLQFQISDFLTPAAAAHYDELTKSGCFLLAYASCSSIGPGQVLKKGWDENPYFKQLMALNRVGAEPIRGPLFIASGTEDDSVPSSLVEKAIRQQCKAGGQFSYKAYPGDHSSMMRSSFKEQLSWIRDQDPRQACCKLRMPLTECRAILSREDSGRRRVSVITRIITTVVTEAVSLGDYGATLSGSWRQGCTNTAPQG